MAYAELHHQVVAGHALAHLVMGGVALLPHQLLLLADCRAILAALTPVPLLRKVPLRTWAALSAALAIAVTADRCARWALVAQMKLKSHRVSMLVLVRLHVMKGPGNGGSEKLRRERTSERVVIHQGNGVRNYPGTRRYTPPRGQHMANIVFYPS